MPRALDGCIKCGACQRACPVLQQEGAAAFPGPRRLAVEGPRFNEELLALRENLLCCTTCGRCESACPSNLPLPEALVRVRSRLRPHGDVPEGQKRMVENVDRTGRTVVGDADLNDAPREGDLLYFPGCIAAGRLTEEVASALALLRATGLRPYVPKGWVCCGSPLEKIGDQARLERVRAENRRLMYPGTEAVASCPGCTVQLRRAYGVEAWHIIEMLHRRGGPDLSMYDPRAPPVKVALHRPCHLSRAVGPHTIDQAKDILGNVPGVTLVEYPDEDGCCGGGGGVASSRPEIALRMAKGKVEAARKSGAEVLLAPCPFCVVNLRRAGGLEVRELTSFLAGRLGAGRKP
jgi:fumarate reductase (CoM/CoB) subunit B